jgi:hypothetical protein
VDSNLGWKGAEKYIATVPQIFDLWQDPQERYDLFMNNFTERSWMAVPMEAELKKVMATYIKYPPRKMQGLGYSQITISQYQRFKWLRDQLKAEGFHLSLPTGN